MTIPAKLFYVQIPIDQKGVEEWNFCAPIFEKMEHFEFTEPEACFLDSLFMQYNEQFGLLIDQWEDEEMSADHVPEALAMAQQFAMQILDESMRSAINRFIEALELALKLKMPVYFDF